MTSVAHFVAASSCALALLAAPRAGAEPGNLRAQPHAGARWLAAGPPAMAPPSVRLPLRLPTFLQLSRGASSRGAAPRATRARTEETRADCGTRCLDRRAADKARTLTAAAIAGVTATGVGAGIVLVLSHSKRERLVPVLGVRLSGQKAVASASWRF